MENQIEINRKLRSGDYTLAKKQKATSAVWNKFMVVIDKTVRPDRTVGAQCQTCKLTMSYDPKNNATSHLGRHKCSIKPESAASFMTPKEVHVPKEVKSSLTEIVSKWCCTDIRPYEIVEDKGLLPFAQKMVDIGAKYGKVDAANLLPHPTTVSRRTHEIADTVMALILPEIMQAMLEKRCCVTTDHWTEDMTKTSYTAITVHYINQQFELVSKVLATASFQQDRKTGELVRREIIRILTGLGITREMISNLLFVTDEGSNMVCGLNLHDRRNCVCHNINRVLVNTFNEEWLNTNLPEYAMCLSATKSLVTYLKQSGKSHDLPKTVKQDVETRWNSKLTMLESVFSQYDNISALLFLADKVSHIEDVDKGTLDTLIKFLKPFREHRTKLEAENHPTLPEVLIVYHKLLDHTTGTDEDSLSIKLLKTRAHTWVKQKFSQISITDHIGAFLWPRRRNLKMLSADEKAAVHIELRRQCVRIQAGTTDAGPPPSKKVKLDRWDDSDDEEEEEDDEVTRYIRGPHSCDDTKELLTWWKTHQVEFPKLAVIARNYLHIQASSTSSERNFSIGGQVVSRKRTQLSEESVNHILFLHSNL